LNLYRARGVRAIGNEVTDCQTSGIILGATSFGAQAIGNTIYNVDGSGIYIESNASQVGWEANGEYRGAIAASNTVYDCGVGIKCSYAPGSIIRDNVCQKLAGDGIMVDSQGVSVTGNLVLNSYLTAGNPLQLVKAGIRVYSGGGECVIVGNVCTDNQATKTQLYGIAVSDDDHVVLGNMLKGNATAGLYQAGTGASNSVANNEV
jgi:hypothetical protein